MGKYLKGKESGKGICQRKDGLYRARIDDIRFLTRKDQRTFHKKSGVQVLPKHSRATAPFP